MAKHLAPSGKHVLETPKKNTPERVRKRTLKKPSRERFTPSFDAVKRIPDWLLIGGALALLVLFRFLPLKGWMIPVAYFIALILVCAAVLPDAIDKLKNRDFFNNECVTILTSILLFILHHFFDAVLLAILFAVCKTVESILIKKSEEEFADLLDILPEKATLVTADGLETVSPDEVMPGDVILVSAGERIPLDGIVTDGITTIDTAAISGQRSPWAVNKGYRVYSGCVNLTSDIQVRVTRPFSQSTVKRLVRLSESATQFPSEQEHNTARVNTIYVPTMLILALIVGILVPAFKGDWGNYAVRAAVILIAARPAANLFCMPIIYRKGLFLAAKFGTFAKGEDCLEAIAKAETVIFDKTGTITEGRYTVTDVYPVKLSEHQLLTIAAMAESFSRHPIAVALREAAGEIDSRLLKVIKIKEIPGRGVSAFLGDRQVYVGNAAHLTDHGIQCSTPEKPGTAIHVAVDGRYCGYIIVADKVRRRAFDALEGIRVNGIDKLVLLTGDVHSVARPLASRLNFDMLRAELRPDDKKRAVEYLMNNKGEHKTIAFVGDGDNDSGIMTKADVGLAMGALGSDAALAAADVLIMDRDIMKIPRMVSLSKLVYSISWQNFLVGMIGNLLIAVFGLLGVFSPLAAELVYFVINLAVLGNTLRVR